MNIGTVADEEVADDTVAGDIVADEEDGGGQGLFAVPLVSVIRHV